nr:reverse transcriptase domain-containing protein [Tanacetum cinerariifolium]
MPRECLSIIESKSKVCYSRNKPDVAKVSTNASTSGVSPDVVELKDMVKALLLDKKGQNQSPAPVKAVEESCVTYGGAHSYRNCPATDGNNYHDNIQEFVSQASALADRLISCPVRIAEDVYVKVVENEPEATKDTVNPTNNGNTEDFQPQVVQSESPVLISEPTIALKLPEKLGDPGKFLIPCDFPGMAECLALANLGASINLMPFSVWKRLSLPDLTPTCMTLHLADRLISCSVRVAEDVYVKVGELTLRVGKEAITFNLDQTSRYSANYSDMTAKRIDVINMACEEYSQEVLGFSDTISSGNPTPYYDSIIFATSLTLTLFGNSDFLLEEVDAFLAIEDEHTSSEFHQSYLDPKRDILLLEAFLNDDPSSPPPNQRNYLPEVHKELKICEAKFDKSSVDEPQVVEFKALPFHLEYAFLEGDDKLPVIIAKDLSVEEKTAFITVLKFHKRAIAWKLSDIKGINPEFCTHKILMEEDFEPTVQHQRRVNPKIHDVIKQEVIKLLAAGLIYPISDSPWDQEKTTFTCPYGTFAYRRMPFRLCNAPGTFQRCMMAIFHDMIEKTMEVFMDDFSVFGNSFQVLGQRQDKHFSPIHYASKTMTEAESKYTTTEKEMLAVVYAFKKFWSYLILNRSIVYTDHSDLKYMFVKKDSKARFLRWVLLLHEFTFKVVDTKGAENLATDHLSRLENPHQNVLDPKEINESFPLETLNLVSTRGVYLARKLLISSMLATLDQPEVTIDQITQPKRKIQINELNELRDQAYENSLIYKEKTKRIHDSKIKNRVFNIGDRVLLFNSHLKIFSGKLKSCWSGPFTISQVYPYSTVELSQPDGPNFKVNVHRLKHYFGEDVSKLVVPDL